jgi:subtilisin family serine protease
MVKKSVTGGSLSLMKKTGEKMVALNVVLEDHVLHQETNAARRLQLVNQVMQDVSKTFELNGITRYRQVMASSKKFVLVVPDNHISNVAQILASHLDVHWIEPRAAVGTLNQWARWITQTGVNGDAPLTEELHGTGEIVGIADSGLDYNSCYFYDETQPVPFTETIRNPKKSSAHRKIHEIWALIDKVAANESHGTHVAGSILGKPMSGLNSAEYNKFAEFNGMASDAKVLFTDIGCADINGCTCHGAPCPCDLTFSGKCSPDKRSVYPPLDLNEDLFPYAYASGARIHSNSWGGGAGFGYGSSAMEIDRFSWDHKDFLILFAAGNAGDLFGYGSLGVEAESKNAIAVGATMNNKDMFKYSAENVDDYDVRAKYFSEVVLDQFQCNFDRCQNFTPGFADLCDFLRNFTTEADCCAQSGYCEPSFFSPCGCGLLGAGSFCCKSCALQRFNNPYINTIYSAENLAYFSSRGPTTDLRIKPDLCAPGFSVISTRSYNTQTSPLVCTASTQFNPQRDLMQMGGTSMATPIIAGNAALVRQYYVDGYHASGVKNTTSGFNPSAALVKATLINSGRPLKGTVMMFDENIPLTPNGDSPILVNPKLLEGHGRVTLMDSLYFATGNLQIKRNLLLGRKEYVRLVLAPSTSSSSTVYDDFGDPIIEDGDAHEYCFTLAQQSGTRLKATLVWTDYPSSPTRITHLVNNLDLILQDPKGRIYHGNMPANSNARDSINNVEQVEISSPSSGNYMVRIEASVTKGPQPYALVISAENAKLRQCNADDKFFGQSANPFGPSVGGYTNIFLAVAYVIIGILILVVVVLGILVYIVYKRTQDYTTKGMRLNDAQEVPEVELSDSGR